MKTSNWWRTQGSFPMIATHSVAGEEADAEVIDGEIIVNVVNLGNNEYITIKTPFAFKVIDFYIRITSGGERSNKTITLQNSGNAISSAVSAATDKGIARTTELDTDEVDFDRGDDDLKLLSNGYEDAVFMAVIAIVPR